MFERRRAKQRAAYEARTGNRCYRLSGRGRRGAVTHGQTAFFTRILLETMQAQVGFARIDLYPSPESPGFETLPESVRDAWYVLRDVTREHAEPVRSRKSTYTDRLVPIESPEVLEAVALYVPESVYTQIFRPGFETESGSAPTGALVTIADSGIVSMELTPAEAEKVRLAMAVNGLDAASLTQVRRV